MLIGAGIQGHNRPRSQKEGLSPVTKRATHVARTLRRWRRLGLSSQVDHGPFATLPTKCIGSVAPRRRTIRVASRTEWVMVDARAEIGGQVLAPTIPCRRPRYRCLVRNRSIRPVTRGLRYTMGFRHTCMLGSHSSHGRIPRGVDRHSDLTSVEGSPEPAQKGALAAPMPAPLCGGHAALVA